MKKLILSVLMLSVMLVMVGGVSGYDRSLTLENKDPSTWQPITGDGIQATLQYNSVGQEFEYRLTSSSFDENYVLIYYADQPDRFTVWGGAPALLLGTLEAKKTILEGSKDTGDLPWANDWNIDPDLNYCDHNNGYDDYNSCSGAKIWLIPLSDYDGEDKVLKSWNPENYLFETDLINYDAICLIKFISPTEGTNWTGTQTIEWKFEGSICEHHNYKLNYKKGSCEGHEGWEEIDSIGTATTSYEWDTASTEDGRDYCIELTDNNGERGISGLFTIDNTPPEAVASADQTQINEGEEVNFNSASSSDGASGSGIMGYEWAFGDGTTSDEQNPTHTYVNDGCYIATLTVTDYVGLFDVSNPIEICVTNLPPEVDAGENQSVNEGQEVTINPTFRDAGSEDTHTATIDWNDGTVEYLESVISPIEAKHTYMTNGTYVVIVTVKDNAPENNEGSDNLTITVDDLGPIAGFSWDVGKVEGEEVRFTDESTTPADEIVSWLWEFGDGETSVQQNPTHTYENDGTYTVTLTVTDSDGSSDPVFHCVVIGDSVSQVSFTEEPISPDEGQEVQFTDTSTAYDGVVSWLWEFGDGETSVQQNPTHTYENDGTYTVTLTVTDSDNSVNSTTEEKIVNNVAPQFSNLPNSSIAIVGELFEFDVDATDVPADVLIYSLISPPNGMSIDSSTGEISWIPTSIQGREWTVTVRISDDDEFTEEDLSINVYDYQINLYKGWNLISIPLVPENDNTSIDAVLSGISENVYVVWAYTYDEFSDKNVWSYHNGETGEYIYLEAKNFVTDILLYKEVKLVKDVTDRDKYGRLLRYIYLEDGTFVNEQIVRVGYGVAYPYGRDTSLCPLIENAEREAREDEIGIWAIEEEEEELEEPDTNYVCSTNVYNCGDFNSHSEAQYVFEYCGGLSNDVHRLDGDNDGIACEGLSG